MATYQEQLEKTRASNATKAMVAFAELAMIGDALAILERDGIFTADDRFTFLQAYVLKHPEINKAFAERGTS